MDRMSDPSARDWSAFADRRAERALVDGEPTRWFEETWSSGARDEIDLPWDRTAPYPPVVEHVAGDPGAGRRAVVIGAGLGADAEFLEASGWRTTAFDIAPSAVRLAGARYPGTAVDYRVADLLDLPDDLVAAFDLVVEVFTVQALPRSVRADAMAGVRALVAPGGRALVAQFVRTDDNLEAGPPWLLDRGEMDSFAVDGFGWDQLGTRPHPLRTDGPRLWVGVLRRTS
jgi:hypothetical protein